MKLFNAKTASRRSEELESARRKQKTGKILMALGLAPTVFFGARGGIRARRAMKAVQQGATADLDHARQVVMKHLAKTGKRLPEFRWASAVEDMPRGGFRIEFGKPKPVPVFTDKELLRKALDRHLEPAPKLMRPLAKWLRLHSGPHFGWDYIYTGNGKVNPKVLLHELGHAADMAERGQPALVFDQQALPLTPRKWLRTFIDPDSSRLVEMESRAWNNAGIGNGDRLRELALDTYRNAAQMRASQMVSTPVGWLGVALNRRGRLKEKELQET